jgi:hypothetical protein
MGTSEQNRRISTRTSKAATQHLQRRNPTFVVVDLSSPAAKLGFEDGGMMAKKSADTSDDELVEVGPGVSDDQAEDESDAADTEAAELLDEEEQEDAEAKR